MSEQLHPHWRIQYIRTRKEPGAGSPFAALLAAGVAPLTLAVAEPV